jgi:MoaA/NifB/PqqE/SkfB family radical SAM enzyme
MKVAELRDQWRRLRSFLRNNRDIMGYFDRRWAYAGPEIVQIDLTNACNNDCIACWCRSPMLGDKALPRDQWDIELPYDKVIELLDDLVALGCGATFLAGSGEPMMHTRIMDVLAAIKERGLRLYLNTNFTLIDRERADRFIEIGLDEITASLWAATPAAYDRTHPNKDPQTFESMLDVLRHIRDHRRDGVPRIKIYNVISNLNYRETAEMTRLALELGADIVEYTVVDTIPERTDSLLLDPEEAAVTLDLCDEIEAMVSEAEREGRELMLSQFDVFRHRLSNLASGKAEYESGIIEQMPCYIGLIFARILPDGNVNGCLKAHRIPVGNILERPFREIWNSRKHRDFRFRTLRMDPEDPIFAMIGNDPEARMGCYRSCDDIGRNRCFHERLQRLTPGQRALLRTAQLASKLRRGYFELLHSE